MSSINPELDECSAADFNLTGGLVECNAQLSKVIYDEFAMDTTTVTEFNLFCNEEYKVKCCRYL